MRNAGLEEAQAGTKIAGRNINNLIYADDTTLRAESEEELKSLLMKLSLRGLKIWKISPADPTKVLQKEISTDFSLAHIDCLF